MMIISTLDAVLSFIEKVLGFVQSVRKRKRDQSAEQVATAEKLLQDVRTLIERYGETVDIIIETVAAWRDDARDVHMAKCMQANRKLFEIAGEMRIIARSIAVRPLMQESDIVETLENHCHQIIYVENCIAVALAPRSLKEKLPLNPDWWYLWRNDISSKLDHRWLPPPYFEAGLSELHSQVLRLHDSKEAIAILLQQATSNSVSLARPSSGRRSRKEREGRQQ